MRGFKIGIVLDENAWALEMIESRSMGKKPYETCRRVARYYIDHGYSKKKVREKLDEFVLSCDPKASLPLWSNLLDRATKQAIKYPAIGIDKITISESEMEKISEIQSRPTKRLAFTLLCLSKYNSIIQPNSNGWVSTPRNEIMTLANIKTSVARRCAMFKTLSDMGMIQLSNKVDSTNVRVLFSDNESSRDPTRYEITSFTDLGNRYLMFIGEPYFECENCGSVVKYSNPQNHRRQKYCAKCAAMIHTQQKVNSAMRRKSAHSSVNFAK